MTQMLADGVSQLSSAGLTQSQEQICNPPPPPPPKMVEREKCRNAQRAHIYAITLFSHCTMSYRGKYRVCAVYMATSPAQASSYMGKLHKSK